MKIITRHPITPRKRFFSSFLALGGLLSTFIIGDTVLAHAEELTSSAVTAMFGLGGKNSAQIDEHSGTLTVQVPLVQLPGIPSEFLASCNTPPSSPSHPSNTESSPLDDAPGNLEPTHTSGFEIDTNPTGNPEDTCGVTGGRFDVGLTYRHDTQTNRFALGKGWTWNIPYIDTDAGMRVFPTSGGEFEADASTASGLKNYVLGNVVFSQENGTLPAREGVNSPVDYAFSLENYGGITDFFNATGDLVARTDMFNNRLDMQWDTSHRLMSVIDGSGSVMHVMWTETGATILHPTRSDGITPETTLAIEGDRLTSVATPVHETTTFTYSTIASDDISVSRIVSSTGAQTTVSYRILPDEHTAVETVRTEDSLSGTQLAVRHWNIISGDHTWSGWPAYPNETALWESGDNAYRYYTELSNENTQIVSEYNSLGLLLNRSLTAPTPGGDTTLREQQFTYPVTENNTPFDPQTLPKHYQKPIAKDLLFRDEIGRTRNTSEHTQFNENGQKTSHTTSDGTTTTTVYDTHIPAGKKLPLGIVVNHTTTGLDGTETTTVNTPSPDHTTIATSETFTGTHETLIPATRAHYTVTPNGLLAAQRITTVDTVNTSSFAPVSSPAAHPTETITEYSHLTHNDGTATDTTTTAAHTSAATTTSTTRDTATGLPLEEHDAANLITKNTYDPAGRVLTQTDPAQRITTTQYENTVTRTTDPTGVTRSDYVDPFGQRIKTTDNIRTTPDGAIATPGFERTIEKRAFDRTQSTILSTDARGLTTTAHYDIFGRVTNIIFPTGIHQKTEHDDIANTTRTGVVTGTQTLHDASRVTTTTRDNTNRIINEIGQRNDGITVPESQTQYDGIGRVVEQNNKDISTHAVFNPDGTPKTTTLTPLSDQFPGQPIATAQEYSPLGLLAKKTVTHPGKEYRRDGIARVFDAAGRPVEETDQAGQSTEYTYTVDGLVEQSHNSTNGTTTHNTYDPVTRKLTHTATTLANGTVSSTAYEYDPVTDKTIAIYSPENPDGTRIGYTYDIFGNLIETSYSDGKTIRSSFDENGSLTHRTDIDGNTTSYEYNSFGFLTRVTQTSRDSTTLAEVKYTYDTLGRITELSRNNGVTTRYTFTASDDIKTETVTHGATQLSDSSYTYDSHGNLTKRIDNRNTTETSAPTPPTQTTTYAYDAYDRLTASTLYDGTSTTETPRSHTEYTITPSGDITQENTTTLTSPPSVREFEYNALGHLTAITTNGARAEQHYDPAGNLIGSSNGTTFTYNAYNQPVTETHPDGTILTHTYWANGSPATTTNASPAQPSSEKPAETHTTRTYWVENTLINETHTHTTGDLTDSAGPTRNTSNPTIVNVTNSTTSSETVASYLIGAARHARTISGPDEEQPTTEHYITDRHGNITATTNTNGKPTTLYTYTDYGHPTIIPLQNSPLDEAHRNPFQYAGEYTTDTGTQKLRNRTYDPNHMRFTTQDTAKLHNLYAYANANPITLIDPSGQDSKEDHFQFENLRNGFWAIVGLSLAIAGTLLSIPAEGSMLVTYVLTVVALTDGILTSTQVVDEYVFPDLLDDYQASWFAGASLVLGLASFLVGAVRNFVEKSFTKGSINEIEDWYNGFSETKSRPHTTEQGGKVYTAFSPVELTSQEIKSRNSSMSKGLRDPYYTSHSIEKH